MTSPSTVLFPVPAALSCWKDFSSNKFFVNMSKVFIRPVKHAFPNACTMPHRVVQGQMLLQTEVEIKDRRMTRTHLVALKPLQFFGGSLQLSLCRTVRISDAHLQAKLGNSTLSTQTPVLFCPFSTDVLIPDAGQLHLSAVLHLRAGGM